MGFHLSAVSPSCMPAALVSGSQNENMTLRECEYGLCPQPAERDVGSCIICSSHFCAENCQIPFHRCPSQVRCGVIEHLSTVEPC